MDRNLIVISIDSFVTEDLEIMKKLPNFSRLIAESSIVERMESTYPTLTHSIHTSIFTGCYPEHHGVIANELFLPGVKNPTWFNYANQVKVPTLAQECAKAGYETAYVFWPLTIDADSKWRLHRPGIHDWTGNYLEIVEKMSTPGLYDEVKDYCNEAWKQPKYFDRDDFALRAVEQLILLHQPDIIYCHITLIDHERHDHGVFNERLEKAYEFIDAGIGRILNALKEKGLYDKTIFNITSDHGQLDVKRVVAPNILFQQNGLQTVDSDGRLTEWKAYCQACALSAQIYVKDHDPELVAQVKKLLEDNKETLGVESVSTRAEVKEKFHLDGEFDLVIETDGVTSYWSRITGPMVQTIDNSSYMGSKATHGHQPHKGVQPSFILRNPFTDKKVVIPNGRIVDQAPTLAKLLGCEMLQADGKPMAGLI